MSRRAFQCVASALVLSVIAPLSAMGQVPGGRIYYAAPSVVDVSVFRDSVWSTAPDGSNDRWESRFDSIGNLNNQIFLPVLSHHTRVFAFSTFSSQIFTVPEAGSTLRALQSPPVDPTASFVSNNDFAWHQTTTCWRSSALVLRAAGSSGMRCGSNPQPEARCAAS